LADVSTATTDDESASTDEELDTTTTTDEELTATDEELATIAAELAGTADELEIILPPVDLAFDFFDAELAGTAALALVVELAGATTAELMGAFETELAGTVAVASCSNSAKRSRTWANDTWASERPKNNGKRAILRI